MYLAIVVDIASHFCSFDYYNLAPFKSKHVARSGFSFIKVTHHICICVPFKNKLRVTEAQALLWSSSQISEYPLYRFPMIFSWIGKKSSHQTNDLSNVCPYWNHCLLQRTYCRGIGNHCHFFFFLSFNCGAWILAQLEIIGKWRANRFNIVHVKSFKHSPKILLM